MRVLRGLPGPLWCACLIAALGVLPLLALTIPMSSDGLFHLYRVWELDRLWGAGVWFPQWAPDFYFGYGYPLFHFTPLLPYVVVELFHLAGLSLPGAMRAVLALGLPASSAAAYLLARSLMGRWPAMLAAVAYALAPYHILNLYGRTDLPEYLAAIWFPLILWATVCLAVAPTRGSTAILAMSSAGLLLTHNLSALMFSPIAALVGLAAIIVAARSRVGTAVLLLPWGALLGVGIAASFWIPALADRGQVQFDRLLQSYGFAAHFSSPGQLLSHDPLQRYPAVFSFAHEAGYQFALWQSVAVAASLVMIPTIWRRKDTMGRILLVGSPFVCVAMLLMATPFSESLWVHWPMLSLAQFPWRFLGLAALPAALCAASLVEQTPVRVQRVVALSGALVIAIASLAELRPINTIRPADALTPAGYARFELQYRLVGTSAAGEYLPRAVTNRAETSPRTFELAIGDKVPNPPDGPLPYASQNGLNRVYEINQTAAGTVTLDTLAFSGLSATVDGSASQIQAAAPSGLVSVSVPAGRHTVELKPSTTLLWRVAGIVSIGSMALLLVMAPWREWRRAWKIRTLCSALAACVVLVLAVGLIDRQSSRALAMFADGSKLDIVPPGLSAKGAVTELDGSVSLPITYSWQVPDSVLPVVPYVRLVTSDRQIWAGSVGTTALPGTSGTGTLALSIPNGTPPGMYTLESGLAAATNVDTNQPLHIKAISSSGGLPLNDTLPVATIVVGRNREGGPDHVVRVFGDVLARGAVSFALEDGTRMVIAEPGSPTAVCPPQYQPTAALCMAAGTALQVAIPWHNQGVAGRNLNETLRLVDHAGAVWSSVDREPAGGRYPTPIWHPDEQILDRITLPIPSYIPPGEYKIALIALLDGQPLNLRDAAGKFAGNEDTLATVSLSAATHEVPFSDIEPPVPPAPHRDAGLGLRLHGSIVSPPHLQAGEQLHVRTLWAATGSSRPDALLRFTVLSEQGVRTALSDAQPFESYPSSQWTRDVPVLSQLSVRVPAALTKGDYVVEVSLHASGSEGPILALGHINIDAPRVQTERHPAQALDAMFGGEIRLTGFDPAPPMTFRSGANNDITLFWRGERPLARSFVVSLQLVDGGGKLVAQHDSPPDNGRQPTSAWIPDRQIVDTHTMAIPDLPSGEYGLLVIVYDPATGDRLRLADGSDVLSLTTVVVGG